jgi:thiosulfate/3-mercaptopyruvate sulfurtransferase
MPYTIAIEPEALYADLDRVAVLDASWIYPVFNSTGIDMRREYARCHIPGAQFVDLAALRDPGQFADRRLDMILTPPRPGALRAALAQADIDTQTPIVVYDMDGGATTAPFLRYCLLDAGFADVRLLRGGLPGWRNLHKLPVTDDGPRVLDSVPQSARAIDADPALNDDPIFIGYKDFNARKNKVDTQDIDARMGDNRFAGLPEDYGRVSIPATHRIAYGEIIEDKGFWQEFQDAESLSTLFNSHGLHTDREIITHCYFGMAACNIMTALELAGFPRGRVYAGGVIDYAVKSGLVSAPAAG